VEQAHRPLRCWSGRAGGAPSGADGGFPDAFSRAHRAALLQHGMPSQQQAA